MIFHYIYYRRNKTIGYDYDIDEQNDAFRNTIPSSEETSRNVFHVLRKKDQKNVNSFK